MNGGRPKCDCYYKEKTLFLLGGVFSCFGPPIEFCKVMTHNLTQEYHLLLIQDLGQERTVCLNAATYAVGRDSSNAIVVEDPTVSRQHCLLIRVPVNHNSYIYRIVDGDITGLRSKNGFQVNEQSYSEKILETQDKIQVGAYTTMSYMVANMTPVEFDRFFGSTVLPFHTVKDEIVDPTGTLTFKDPQCA